MPNRISNVLDRTAVGGMKWEQHFHYSEYEVYEPYDVNVYLYRRLGRPIETESWEINGGNGINVHEIPLGPSEEPPFEYAEALIRMLAGGG